MTSIKDVSSRRLSLKLGASYVRHTPDKNWFEERECPINKEKSIYANASMDQSKPTKTCVRRTCLPIKSISGPLENYYRLQYGALYDEDVGVYG